MWALPDDPLFLASPPVTEEILWYENLYEGIVGERWVRHECWNWDGIRGQSMLFHREDVWDAPDQVLVAIVNEVLARAKKSPEIGGVSVPYTITRKLTMVFVNWGFHVV